MPEQPQPPPTDGTDISALAAVMNPVTVGLQEKKVFVWANSTDNSTLGFQQRPLYSSKKQDFIGHKGTNQTPKITNPSTLAAIVRDDMVSLTNIGWEMQRSMLINQSSGSSLWCDRYE